MLDSVHQRSEPELDALERAVSHLPGISLGDIGAAALLDRLDRKFLVPREAVLVALGRAEGYRVLEVSGSRLGRYRTLYYDTAGLELYRAHHSGQLPRNKVRVRSYLDSGARYFEVKRRTNRGRTEKSRSPIPDSAGDLLAGLTPSSTSGLDAGVAAHELREALMVDFTRITLVAEGAAERVTVDVAIELSRGGALHRLPGVAVVEVKQEEAGPSRFADILRSLGLREGGLSKYCMGIALLEPAVKHNCFKPVLRRLEQMGGSPARTRQLKSEAG
jgi:hypothetical protein